MSNGNLLIEVVKVFKNLKGFTCEGCRFISDELLIELSKHLTKLNSLTLISSADGITDASLSKILSVNESSLKTLFISEMDQILPVNLTSLSLLYALNMTDDDVNYILLSSNLANLKVLKITENDMMSGEGLSTCCLPQSLTELEFYSCHGLSWLSGILLPKSLQTIDLV
eukprot:gene16392-22344_t